MKYSYYCFCSAYKKQDCMSVAKNSRKSYFELSKHDFPQIITFTILLVVSIGIVFLILLPLLEQFFAKFLSGIVYNDGQYVPYLIDTKSDLRKTHYFYTWAVDIYVKTPQESRYWFNPFLSIISSASIIGAFFAISISSVLPATFGFMRQKIEREIANLVNTITMNYYGSDSNAEQSEIIDLIKTADLQKMYEHSEDWGVTVEDLKILQRALIWRENSFFYKIFRLNDGITMYMRFYFTAKYGNAVLGFVYIGAAVLIIIVGLRGLKFIPPTQPSVVLFALGLEFTLLVTYAFSLIYTKQDEESELNQLSSSQSGEFRYLSSDFGSSREVEKLLRVFIRSKPGTTKKTDDRNK